MAYAERTKVTSRETENAIRDLLERYSTSGYMSGETDRPDGSRVAVIGFRYNGKAIRFTLALPEKEQARNAAWRALLLSIKAKLITIESGIATFEEEFLSWVVLPNKETVGEMMLPRIENAVRSGEMPKLTWNGE